MPRPRKWRKVCCLPESARFGPLGNTSEANPMVTMTIDEYETIRLIDLQGFTQEECAKQMDVARTTVQGIYDSARKKLADSLVNGKVLLIEGGDYILCSGQEESCGCGGCRRHRCRGREEAPMNNIKFEKERKNDMKLAVTYENGEVFQHFGHSEQFKIYDINDGKVTATDIRNTNGSGHGALVEFLKKLKVDMLICGGIGDGAKRGLEEADIKLFAGVAGAADEAVEALLKKTLIYASDATCDHQDEHTGATCGEHGCGKGEL